MSERLTPVQARVTDRKLLQFVARVDSRKLPAHCRAVETEIQIRKSAGMWLRKAA